MLSNSWPQIKTYVLPLACRARVLLDVATASEAFMSEVSA